MFYLLYSFLHLGINLYQVEKELNFYRQQKAALLAEQARLQEEIQKLNSDTYIERVAREELGFIKPGEKIILPARPAPDIPPYVPPPPGHEFRD
ncbi:Cell division protein FtsB [Thermanaeromonas toyohensis ToBE]|uniref:Cell division protein FtsB n=1 Tax=Thermanaeromonas toyohensis ToBE TaxID=698762 RepID=A0A1W1V7W0_9FIRM|nr:septum formation initiator family protein [Thermanaeromonas toyohensis]SMB89509.1 Cell division protein FtsB [Thermanaeromonas toyohensis ToBE]